MISMTRRSQSFAVLTGAVMLAAPTPVAQAQGGRPAGPDVRVVNTSDQPVPVSVQGAVALSAPVVIDAAAPLPVMVVGGAVPQPVQLLFSAPDASTVAAPYTVPAGKRLVIEQVSCAGAAGDDTLLGVTVTTVVGGTQGFHTCAFDVRVNLGRPGTATSYRGARMTRFYADAGTQVRASFDGGGGAFFSLTVSGVLVDVP